MSNAADQPNPDHHVEAVDAQGRRVRIPRDEYVANVLPAMLKANHDNPDALTGVVMQAVRDGLAEHVMAAANRLTVIDKNNLERALSVLAIVQRDAGEDDLAEATLRELLQRKPGSPAAYVGLGMLEQKRGNADACEQLLWQALEQDCNFPDAVQGFLQVREQRVGKDGMAAELAKIIALPGAFRARLFQARLHLSEGRADDAAQVYRDVLADDAVVADALVMAAADLVQNKQHDLLVELVVPRFEPGRHHPQVGIAILEHHRLREQHVEGEQLLHRMYVHYGHQFGPQLQPYSAEFDRMRLQQLPPLPELPANPRLQLMRLDRPLWCAGYDDPQWLLPAKQPGHKHVMVFALAIEDQPQLEPERAEEVARATRSLPLWLAEQVWLATPHRGTAAIPLTENGGWVVLGRPWPIEQLVQQVPADEREHTILVTGKMRIDGDRRHIELQALDCGSNQVIGQVQAEGGHDEHGKMLLQLIGALWPVLGQQQGFQSPITDPGYWHRYVEGLVQHAAVVLTQMGLMPRERLFGERMITNWLQSLALSETRWQPGMWLLGSCLCTLRQLGSKVPAEHARLVAEAFRQSPPQIAFARLGSRILPACGLEPLWQGRKDEVLAAAANDATVHAWLQAGATG